MAEHVEVVRIRFGGEFAADSPHGLEIVELPKNGEILYERRAHRKTTFLQATSENGFRIMSHCTSCYPSRAMTNI
jgi:hypothetical protein